MSAAKKISPISNKSTPKDGIIGFVENWRSDLLSGFILFLIALPLSVGIAMASGAPPAAGFISAIVGGVIGSILGSGRVTINGPAAGLIVVVLASVQEIGFKQTLTATVIAGAVQIIFGLARAGKLALKVSTSVIHGMMMAIGVIIMSKQIHLALGVSPQAKSIFGLIGEIPHSFLNLNPELAAIGLGSLLLLVLYPRIKNRYLNMVPAPLVAVVFGLFAGELFDLEHPHAVHLWSWTFDVGPKALLNVPGNIRDALVGPEWGTWVSMGVLKNAAIIALVASIESVLSTFAVDQLDPYGRKSDLNRDLWSKGICNVICGLTGGLPIISEIVRSSANISNGAKTRWSNFFHGVFILLFVVLFPTILHKIPLASLAAILTVIGFRLGHPKQLKHSWSEGLVQFVSFSTTLILTLATDLLVGVAVGICANMLLRFAVLRSGNEKKQRAA